MQAKTITIKGVINQKSYEKFKKSISWVKKENPKVIYIHILSEGGEMVYADKMIELIQSIPEGVSVIFVAHYAHSSALLVFLSRGLRIAKKSATFLFHNPSTEGGRATLQEVEKTKKSVIQYISNSLTKSKKEIEKLMSENTYVGSAYAKKIGLVHEIIPDAL